LVLVSTLEVIWEFNFALCGFNLIATVREPHLQLLVRSPKLFIVRRIGTWYKYLFGTVFEVVNI